MIDARCTHSSVVNSVVTGSNLTNFLHDVEKSLTFNLLKSELIFSNSFRNISVHNEGGVANLATKLAAMSMFLERSGNEGQIHYLHLVFYHLVKIW